jgi:heme/copper-type cytochrome/quinol oxidase subunit 2
MKKTTVILSTMMLLLVANAAAACPVCFGDPDAAMTKGAQNGIWVLLGIIGFVQLGFIALFWTFWQRARALKKKREQFRLLEGGA